LKIEGESSTCFKNDMLSGRSAGASKWILGHFRCSVCFKAWFFRLFHRVHSWNATKLTRGMSLLPSPSFTSLCAYIKMPLFRPTTTLLCSALDAPENTSIRVAPLLGMSCFKVWRFYDALVIYASLSCFPSRLQVMFKRVVMQNEINKVNDICHISNQVWFYIELRHLVMWTHHSTNKNPVLGNSVPVGVKPKRG